MSNRLQILYVSRILKQESAYIELRQPGHIAKCINKEIELIRNGLGTKAGDITNSFGFVVGALTFAKAKGLELTLSMLALTLLACGLI
jgi:hypothetical protein